MRVELNNSKSVFRGCVPADHDGSWHADTKVRSFKSNEHIRKKVDGRVTVKRRRLHFERHDDNPGMIMMYVYYYTLSRR